MKRIIDILASSIGLIILSPLFAFIAIWISIESSGGPFYLQERVGLNGKTFRLFKFRSMRKGSDRKGLLTVGKDPRITKSGAFIRKYKIDELPQLINVLIGNMSLVGPRPEVQKYVDLYTEEQRNVLSIKPGITDWASIKYRDENDILGASDHPEQTYIETIMPDKLEINLEYVKKRSIWMDIRIILLTIVRVIQ